MTLKHWRLTNANKVSFHKLTLSEAHNASRSDSSRSNTKDDIASLCRTKALKEASRGAGDASNREANSRHFANKNCVVTNCVLTPAPAFQYWSALGPSSLPRVIRGKGLGAWGRD